MDVTIALILLLPLMLNVVASIRIIKDVLSERQQKIWQLIFVWLLPLIGAIVVLMVYRKPESSSGSYPENRTTESYDSNIRQRSVADDFLE